jgi:hypothetical protein
MREIVWQGIGERALPFGHGSAGGRSDASSERGTIGLLNYQVVPSHYIFNSHGITHIMPAVAKVHGRGFHHHGYIPQHCSGCFSTPETPQRSTPARGDAPA